VPGVVGSVPAASFTATKHLRTVSLQSSSRQVVVRLRRRCGPGTLVRLTVDRRTVVHRLVTWRRYRTVTVPLVLPEGRHRVALLTEGGRSRTCRRPVANGAVRFLATTTGAPVGSPIGTTTDPSQLGGTTTTGADPGTALATPTTADPPATPTRPKLVWMPPTLSAPTTVAVPQGDQTLALDPAKDYIINLGTHLGGLNLKGGRNVVVQGGRVAPPRSGGMAVGLSIVDAVGTVHVEGVWFDGASGHEFDAIQINAPEATVQLENIRATGLRGSSTTNHTDVVQPWGGVAKLRVDRLTATTNYQGIFNQPDQGPIGHVDLRHVDIAYDNVGAKTGGYLLWLANGCTAATTTLSEVYVKGRPGSTLGTTAWPPIGRATNCPGVLAESTAIVWPSLPVTGVARWGTPASGSFVQPTDAGSMYRSPGYD
jgi:hypothetical protein